MPTLCVAALLGTGFGWITTWWAGGMPCGYFLMIPALIVWPCAFYSFGKLCGFKLGWVSILGWYHLAGFSVLVPIALLAVFSAIVEKLPTPWVTGSIGIALLFVVVDYGRRVYKTAKEKLDLFCRGVAVALAREELDDKH